MTSTRLALLTAFALSGAALLGQSSSDVMKAYDAQLKDFQHLLVGRWIDYSTSYTVYAPDHARNLKPPTDAISAMDRPLVSTNGTKDEWTEFRADFSGTQRRFGKEGPIVWRVSALQAKNLNASGQDNPVTVVRGIFQLNLSTPSGELVYEVVVVDSNLLLLQYFMDTRFGVVRVVNQILMRDTHQSSDQS